MPNNLVEKGKVGNKPIYIETQFEALNKAADDDSDDKFIKIKGIANAAVIDRTGDYISSDAWQKGISNFKKNPILLFGHDYSQPVGLVTDIKATDLGLEVEAKVLASVGRVYELVKEGILKAFSVGLIVKDAEYEPKADVFRIKELDLLELSIVSVPANQDSLFSISKSFESEDEYMEFKKQFLVQSEDVTDKNPTASDDKDVNETKMDKDLIESIVKSTAEAVAASMKAATPEVKPEPTTPAIEVGASGAERLLEDVRKQMADDKKELADVIAELRGELKDKAVEIETLQKSKMRFEDTADAAKIEYTEKESAVLLAKAMKKSIADTKLGRQVIEKAPNSPHLATSMGEWETEVSRTLENEIRRRLVMDPLFRSVNMQGPILRIPVNPEAGYATWLAAATDFGTTASSGAAQTHALKDITLTSYKLATKEYINFEEDEDSIIPILPIVRDAIVRRMAKAWDKALLIGAGSGADPIKGTAIYDATSVVVPTNTGVASVANLRALRKDLGVWGLNPADVVFVVSTDIYYDLLEDTSFMTMDKVGTQATLLTGQIGMIGNSPVLVSSEFPTKAGGAATATTNIGAIALASANFLVGSQRGMRMDSDDDVVYQRRVLVNSLRTAMTQISTVNGMGVSTLRWS